MDRLLTRARLFQAIILVIPLILLIPVLHSLTQPIVAQSSIPSTSPSALHAQLNSGSPAEISAPDTSTDVNVIGGVKVQEGAYPWMVALIDNTHESVLFGQFCGGALIHPEWVLTVAHCTYKYGQEIDLNEIDALVGQETLDATTGERIKIELIIRHLGYNSKTGDSDIALLKLASPSKYPPVRMANASMSAIDKSGAIATVLGWGRTSTKHRVNHLRKANVPLVDAVTCTSTYTQQGYTMTPNMLCAGFQQGGTDACSGDSGGPLLVRETEGDENSAWIHVGIISWGRGCARADAYGVYTHTALYKNWVDVQIALNSFANDAGSTIIMPKGQSSPPVQIYMPIINQ